MQPEMARNVQKYSTAVYLRAADAQQCRIHSTLVIPLFASAARQQPMGVLEVVQTVEDMHFSSVVEILDGVLQVWPFFLSRLHNLYALSSLAVIIFFIFCNIIWSTT